MRRALIPATPLVLVVLLLAVGGWQNARRGSVRCAIPDREPEVAAYLVALRAIAERLDLPRNDGSHALTIEAAPNAAIPAGLIFHARCNMLEWQWNYAGPQNPAEAWRITLGALEPFKGDRQTFIVPMSLRPAQSSAITHWRLIVARRDGRWRTVAVLRDR